MKSTLKPAIAFLCLYTALYIFSSFSKAVAQVPLSVQSRNGKLNQGIEQYQQGHFSLAANALSAYLQAETLPAGDHAKAALNGNREKAFYYLVLSNIRSGAKGAPDQAALFVRESVNPAFKQRVALALAQYYFQHNDLKLAIPYYEAAGIANLSNEEIADAKFELAYSYFNDEQFGKAKPLFEAIKELPDHKYYIPGNYYYGLLAYNDKDYKDALKSFERIHKEATYKDIVPYYEAEIHYFLGDADKVLQISRKYLSHKDTLYYDKDMQLLTAQTLFEQKQFEEALPYFENYYRNTDKIRKEELYELAYSYYRLERWKEAIQKFQPLSNAQDSLGQTSMYLLGDCYLKINDKKGARNAFGICADMNFNPAQQEAALFLFSKLSVELGDEAIATRKLYSFIKTYPKSAFVAEARTLLTGLLAKNSNYAEAFNIMSDMLIKDNETWKIYQQVAVGRAMQLMQNKDLTDADSVLNLSLQQPLNPAYEAIAYFWKGEIAYSEHRFAQAIQFSRTFLDKVKGLEEEAQRISAAATVQNANLNIGYAQLELQDFEAAQQAFALAKNGKATGSSAMLGADATLREADALFMQKDFDNAARRYDEAIAANVSDPDYARFQKSIIYGLQGKNAEKKAILNDLISRYPASRYKDDAQYELALAYLSESHNQDAIGLLKTLSESAATAANLKSKASLRLAYAYQQNGNNEQAEAQYKDYIEHYPSASDREEALDALRSLYISESRPEAYAAYLKANNLPEADEESIESSFYDAATQHYADARWEKAAEGFSKYLGRFPNGKYAVKAHFYRGESYYNLKELDKARADYDAVQADGWSDYAEDAAEKSARISFANKDYEKALSSYRELRNSAMDDKVLATAYEGMMRSAFESGQYESASAYADTLLSLPGISKDVSARAQLVKARALQLDKQDQPAIALYQVLDKKNLGMISAEARYRHAEILFGQHKLKEAEAQAGYAAQASGGYDYWVVKCYILLGDILTGEGDYFNAKATLKSIVKNTKIKELKEEAAQKLDQVIALEKARSKLQED